MADVDPYCPYHGTEPTAYDNCSCSAEARAELDEIVAVDFLGNEIRVGDIVLYPRMSGRSCEMTQARVERIDPVSEGRRTTTQAWEDWAAIRPWQDRPEERPEMYETVPAWKFSLMPLRSTRFRRYSWSDKQKPVYIQIGENVVRSPL